MYIVHTCTCKYNACFLPHHTRAYTYMHMEGSGTDYNILHPYITLHGNVSICYSIVLCNNRVSSMCNYQCSNYNPHLSLPTCSCQYMYNNIYNSVYIIQPSFSTCMYTTLYVVHASLLFLWLFNYSRDHVESTHLLHSYVDMYVCNYLLLTVIVT